MEATDLLNFFLFDWLWISLNFVSNYSIHIHMKYHNYILYNYNSFLNFF